MNFILSCILLYNFSFNPLNTEAQPFEGTLTLLKKTQTDTTFLVIRVKGDMVRIDELDKEEHLQTYKLIDLLNNTIKVVNPEKKLYMLIGAKRKNPANSPNYEVEKTGNYKIINNYTCYQWRVVNSEDDTDMTFWVANDNFTFFDDLLRIYGTDEKDSLYYYLQFSNTDGYFPMLAVERSILRKKRMELEVTRIDKAHLSNDLFEVPMYYSPLDR